MEEPNISARCARHPTSNGRISAANVISAGCRPPRIASSVGIECFDAYGVMLFAAE
jgi:hypothetical protein